MSHTVRRLALVVAALAAAIATAAAGIPSSHAETQVRAGDHVLCC